jgi:23S rRNA (pseudouridine1915-N3)-methyltransferase
MQIEVLCPEIKKMIMAEEAVSRFEPRMKRFASFSVKTFKTEKNGEASYKIQKEEAEILKKITEKDYVILLDEKGKSFDTRSLSSKVESVQNGEAYKKIIFLIGGPYGLSSKLKERANLKFSLSDLTFNSEVAIVVLMEQVYRLFTVISGHPYHND